ncbi:hypothetical protein PTSG_05789 [Salpingoeca rosetta]|uniref:Uncharacterized protein n=1 Tax=Salpingoeca rosetta (strain ATCC 50818 / BSB-021) TaxID=946362 RepID=F2UB84_SALR5|nr:uncharacterized protein PTSG_05789 [Salpingoeca rosetta]EGD74097.1 hypothetical protein PTSG_05789 [Salpingoeca rosetta]|eukprot:XP_004993659.1 hypothetical protein PTSG_05789 [Salpingoeca rosetta]
MTVAIHWMPLIASMEQSVGDIGKVLLMAGQSDCFQRVGLQLKRGRGTLLRHKDDGDMRTHCTEMPLHYRTANGGPDVSDDRTAYPSILARAHRSSTDDLSKAYLFVPSTDVSCWCEDFMHGTYSGNIESIHPVSAAIERNLSS